jgi:predicted DsbA family dithiol-disulfide isomerase
MQVEVFSDVVCPWCYIGKRRLEEALSTFPHAQDVTVTYRSFQLVPTTPVDVTGTLADRLATKYGVTGEQAKAMNDRVSGIAETVGLDFRLDDAHPANTFSSHRLLHFAGTRGVQAELKERLMRAYFTEGVNLGERNELIRLATEVGLDRGEVATVLDSSDYTAEVEADLALARGFGISGVPFFVFDRTYGVSGAQESAVLSEVLERAWSESHPLTMVTARGSAGVGVTGRDDGDLACDDDSCAV